MRHLGPKAAVVCRASCIVGPVLAGAAIRRAAGDQRAELAKFDNPKAHLPASDPAGTEWDAQYRSFGQTDENALAKGLPSHADAARQIWADAAKNLDSLRKHRGWVLYIKHYSQAYRPEAATRDLRRLYEELLAMESAPPGIAAGLAWNLARRCHAPGRRGGCSASRAQCRRGSPLRRRGDCGFS